MMKKVMLISATTGLLLVTLAPDCLIAADYKHSGCSDAAKAQFPYNHSARKDFKHWCKDQWKIYKKSQYD